MYIEINKQEANQDSLTHKEAEGILYIIGYAKDTYGGYRATNPHLLHIKTKIVSVASIQLVKEIIGYFDDILYQVTDLEPFASDTSLHTKLPELYPNVEKSLCYGSLYDLNDYSTTDGILPDITSEQLDKVIKIFNDKFTDYSIVKYEMNNLTLMNDLNLYWVERKEEKEKYAEHIKLMREAEEKENSEIVAKVKQFLGEDIFHVRTIVDKEDFVYADLVDYCKELFSKKDINDCNVYQKLFVIMHLFDYVGNEEDVIQLNVIQAKTIFPDDTMLALLSLLSDYDDKGIQYKFDGTDNLEIC